MEKQSLLKEINLEFHTFNPKLIELLYMDGDMLPLKIDFFKWHLKD